MKEIQDKINEGPSMFTESDYEDLKKYGITAEEIEVLKDANAIVTTTKMVPDNVDKFFEKYTKIFANKDGSASMQTFFELSQKDPKFFLQLVAAIDVADKVSVDQPAGVEKVSVSEIEKVNTAETNAQIGAELNQLLADFRKLSPAERKSVLQQIKK